MEVVKDVLIGLTSLIIGYCYFNFQLVFSSTMNPGTHIAAQEKWGGERRERDCGEKGGGRGEQSRKAAAFVRGNDSFTRSLAHSFVEVVPPSLHPSFLPQLQLSQMTRRFHDLGRQTDRNHEYTQVDHPSGSFGL